MILGVRVRDATVAAAFAAAAFFLTAGLWPHPALHAVALNPADQALTEWWLAYGARFWIGDFSLITDRMNSPDGVNAMSNASSILTGIIMGPVTWLYSASVSYALLLAGNLAATGFGWYLLFSRPLGLRPSASILAGAFCAFAPGMISQSVGHVHITAQWLVPAIVYCVIRLVRGQTPAPTGIALGLLITAQLFNGEEVLFITALTLGLLTVFTLVSNFQLARDAWRPLLAGLGIAAGISGVLVAYPLWLQLAGPQHVPNGVFAPGPFSDDLRSFVLLSPHSVGGLDQDGDRFATSLAEKNTHLGWPLVILFIACVCYLWRDRFVRAAAPTAVLLAALALGPEIRLDGDATGIPGPYALIEGIPLIDGALPTRFALAVIPLVGAILALALHRALGAGGHARWLLPLGMAGALVFLLPVPLETVDRTPVPRFYQNDSWRGCVEPGGTLVSLPIPNPHYTEPMRGATAAKAGFGFPGGFFIGPYGEDGKASIFPPSRPTTWLTNEVSSTGKSRKLSAAELAQFRDDMQYWKASCVAVDPGPSQPALKALVEQVYGPGVLIHGTWTWQPTA